MLVSMSFQAFAGCEFELDCSKVDRIVIYKGRVLNIPMASTYPGYVLVILMNKETTSRFLHAVEVCADSYIAIMSDEEEIFRHDTGVFPTGGDLDYASPFLSILQKKAGKVCASKVDHHIFDMNTGAVVDEF